MIGGHLEGGERPEDALVREVQEEVGVTPTGFAPVGGFVETSLEIGPARLHFFVITDWVGGDPEMRGDEHAELRWFDVETACALPDLALPQYRSIFRSLEGMR